MTLFILETIFVVVLPILAMTFSPQVYLFRHLIGVLILGYFIFISRRFHLPNFRSQLCLPSLSVWVNTLAVTLVGCLILIITHAYQPNLIHQMVKLLVTHDKYYLALITYPLFSVPLQEVLFRWFYLHRLTSLKFNPLFSIIWSSVIFSLVHFPFSSPLMLAGTFVLGLWWSYLLLRHHSLPLVSVSHAILGTLILALSAP